MFAAAAKGLGVTVGAYTAAWDEHGNAAGPSRTSGMVRAGAELGIALHRFLANSQGAKDCVRKALAAGFRLTSSSGNIKATFGVRGG